MKKNIVLSSLLGILLAGFLGSCVSVPKATVDLSSELTRMTVQARKSHMALLDEYMTARKAQVDQFMEEQWIPTFTANFVQTSNILTNIQNAPTNGQKGEEIIEFAQAAMPMIQTKRDSLIRVLDEIDKVIRSRVDAHYADMLLVNQALTAHLSSAANVVEIREQLQKQLSANTENLIPVDKINGLLEKLLNVEAKAGEIPLWLEDFKKTITANQ